MNAVRSVGRLPAEAGADAVEQALERHAGDAPHRRLVCEDGDDATRLVAPLRGRGWSTSTEVLMVLREARDRPPSAGLAREVDADTLQPVELATMLDEPELRDVAGARAVAEEVVASRRALAAATPTRWFCGAWEGRDGCNATLFSDGRTAQVENVGTVPDLRGRGLARATVSLAVDAALADGHDLVLIFADDDDWPKELYAKLGFRTVGRLRTFLRSAAPPPRDPAAG
jgi:ribosomal protein S18 acetylase RimI-like enzyme